MAAANLDTGEVGEWHVIWNGTGGQAPEGPHVYLKDGWYYLLAAEGERYLVSSFAQPLMSTPKRWHWSQPYGYNGAV